jgi:hypothetical protein
MHCYVSRWARTDLSSRYALFDLKTDQIQQLDVRFNDMVIDSFLMYAKDAWVGARSSDERRGGYTKAPPRRPAATQTVSMRHYDISLVI